MAMIKGGVSVKELEYTDAGPSFNVNQGTLTQLTHKDTAADMAPSVDDYKGTALAKTSGGVMQEALVYTDISRSVTSFSAKYPYTHAVTIGTGTTATTTK